MTRNLVAVRPSYPTYDSFKNESLFKVACSNYAERVAVDPRKFARPVTEGTYTPPEDALEDVLGRHFLPLAERTIFFSEVGGDEPRIHLLEVPEVCRKRQRTEGTIVGPTHSNISQEQLQLALDAIHSRVHAYQVSKDANTGLRNVKKVAGGRRWVDARTAELKAGS